MSAALVTIYQPIALPFVCRMCSLAFDCVCRWLWEGKRSCDVCSSRVCVLTLAGGWCAQARVCVWAVGTAGGLLCQRHTRRNLLSRMEICEVDRIYLNCFCHLFEQQSDAICYDPPPQHTHKTTPPSFATFAWRQPLQHKHNIQGSSTSAARIISHRNTTLLLCSRSASVPSLKRLSNVPTCWPLAGHPLLADDRSNWDHEEPQFPFACRDCGPAALTYLTGHSNGASWRLSEASHPAIMYGSLLSVGQNVTAPRADLLSC